MQTHKNEEGNCNCREQAKNVYELVENLFKE